MPSLAYLRFPPCAAPPIVNCRAACAYASVACHQTAKPRPRRACRIAQVFSGVSLRLQARRGPGCQQGPDGRLGEPVWADPQRAQESSNDLPGRSRRWAGSTSQAKRAARCRPRTTQILGHAGSCSLAAEPSLHLRPRLPLLRSASNADANADSPFSQGTKRHGDEAWRLEERPGRDGVVNHEVDGEGALAREVFCGGQ